MKTIHIGCEIYKSSLLYIYDCDYKELEKYCRKKFEVEDDDSFEHLRVADGTVFKLNHKEGAQRIVWIQEFKMTPYWLGVLAHETVHAIVRLLDHKGIPYTSNDNQDETFAYLMDYFIAEFIRGYKKKK
jgi:hypothetical protein